MGAANADTIVTQDSNARLWAILYDEWISKDRPESFPYGCQEWNAQVLGDESLVFLLKEVIPNG